MIALSGVFMTDYSATDETIRTQYVPLLREALISLFAIIEQFELQNDGETILNSYDFFHIYDYLWNMGDRLDDPMTARNIWTLDQLQNNKSFPGLNIVASRGTVLEICDSLHHEVERLGETATNRKLL